MSKIKIVSLGGLNESGKNTYVIEIDNKIFILGLARSGYQAAKYLIGRGNTVILNDGKEEDKMDPEQVKELRDLGVELIFGSHPDDILDSSFDYLIKNGINAIVRREYGHDIDAACGQLRAKNIVESK